jgi:hypothetical protein
VSEEGGDGEGAGSEARKNTYFVFPSFFPPFFHISPIPPPHTKWICPRDLMMDKSKLNTMKVRVVCRCRREVGRGQKY